VKDTIGGWLSLFRIIGEIKNSCNESEYNLRSALDKVSEISQYVESLETDLTHKYNLEPTPKDTSND